MEWMLMPLKRYADFQGRSRRMEFWMWIVFSVIVSLVLSVIDGLVGLRIWSLNGGAPVAGAGVGLTIWRSQGVLSLVWTLVALIPNISVAMRRLHDTNRTGWWLLAPVAPYVIGFILTATAALSQSLALIAAGGVLFFVGFVLAVVLIVFYCLPGTVGPNNYGPDPITAHENLAETFQ